MKHNVHLYALVRLKVPGIEAANHQQALEKARELFPELYGLFTERNLRSVPAAISDIEFAEEISHYLVDEDGDKEFAASTWHDGEGRAVDDPHTITVTVTDGLIADVDGIPLGHRVRVLDLDVEGMDEEDLVRLPDGKQAMENIWAAKAA